MRNYQTLADTIDMPTNTRFVVRTVVLTAMTWLAFDFHVSLTARIEAAQHLEHPIALLEQGGPAQNIVFTSLLVSFIVGSLAAYHIIALVLSLLGLRIKKPNKQERKQQRELEKMLRS